MAKGSFLLLLIFLSSAVTIQGQTEKRKSEFNLGDGALALEGYDPVSYFSEGRATKGNRAQALVYEGVTYYFSSAKNKETFRADPRKFEPQYGGWCAFAMGKSGEKVEVDPGTFKIVDGKLYLFYNKYFNNTLKSWNKDEKGLKVAADNNWQKIYSIK